MIAYSNTQPIKLEAVGDGSYRYRWNIQEEQRPNAQGIEGEESEETQWRYNEVIVWNNPTPNSITQAVIADQWSNDREAKLVNEYNAATLGLLDTETATSKINAYKLFLQERAAIKAQIDSDCEELGIY